MNICLLTIDLSTVGGINKVTFDLARDLTDLGNKVLVCGIVNGNKKTFYDNNANIRCLFEEELPMKKYIVNGSKKLIDILKEEKIDVLLLQGEAAGLLGAFTKMKYNKCKYVYCDHGALTYDISGFRRVMTNITLWVCGKFTDYSVFETNKGKNDFQKLVGKNEYKYRYIYNYGNNDVEIVKPSDRIKLVTVGRMTSQKGFDLAVEVAKRIKASKLWTWDFIGNGEDFDEIEAKIKINKLQDRINLLGNVKELEHKYKDYYLMICTSRHEGLPMTLIDAKFAKLPIISFDINTGPNEIILDKINGNLVSPFDVEEMARITSEIIENKQIRDDYVIHAWDNKYKFDKINVLNDWKSFLEEITDE